MPCAWEYTNYPRSKSIVDPTQVALHGTGTPLGDPIEVGALGQALQGRGAPRRGVLTLAAVKSCYGHTEGAAGLTGAGISSMPLLRYHQPAANVQKDEQSNCNVS